MNDRYRNLRKLALFLGLFCFIATTLFAAERSYPTPSTKKSTPKAKIDQRLLFRYVATLASDEFEGRNPAGKGGILAARYIKTKFKKLGLKPGGEQGTYFQPFMASQWRGVPIILELSPPSSTDISTARSAPSLSKNATKDVEAEKQVGDLPDLPDVEALERRAEQKASARKVVSQLKDLFGQGSVYSEYNGLPEESIRRIELAREMLVNCQVYCAAGWFRGWVRDHAGLLGKCRDFQCRNVLALLPGTDSKLAKEVIVVSAHYDHLGVYLGDIYNGADDNASGTAAILEIARVLKSQGTRRSILFIAFDAEEKGLWGSRHWVGHPTVPLDRVGAQINLDMVGRMYEKRVFLMAANSSKELVDLVTEEFGKEKITFYKMDAFPNTDHWPFYRERIPAITFGTGLHYDYHLPTDDTEKIDFVEMERVVRSALESIKRLDARAERVKFSAE